MNTMGDSRQSATIHPNEGDDYKWPDENSDPYQILEIHRSNEDDLTRFAKKKVSRVFHSQ